MKQDISKKAMELFDAHYDVWKSTGVCISKCKDKHCRTYGNDCGAWQIYARISATMAVEFARENSLNTSDYSYCGVHHIFHLSIVSILHDYMSI